MNWYAAHAMMYVRFKDGVQNKYPFWENIFLIQADSDEEAFEKAEQRAKEDEGDSCGSFTWEERPASWSFAGIRKVVDCAEATDQPTDGTELTFLEMEVDSEAAFSKLLNGEPVMVKMI
jgi:hypothetical protein